MVGAVIADALAVNMLYGENVDKRGRRSGILSYFEKGCEGRA
jgi:hypothetical protein